MQRPANLFIVELYCAYERGPVRGYSYTHKYAFHNLRAAEAFADGVYNRGGCDDASIKRTDGQPTFVAPPVPVRASNTPVLVAIWQQGKAAKAMGADVAGIAASFHSAEARQAFLDGGTGKPKPLIE